jgi:translation initiation factor IF-2
MSDRLGVQVRRYDIIYKLTEDIKASLEGMLKPEEREVSLGRALIQKVFFVGKVGAVAGCRVLAGTVERNSRCRIIRDSRIVGDYPIESLRREKDDAREVREGYECGIKLQGFNDLKEADILESYRIEQVAREL